MFIQTSETPNPQALKFLPGQTVNDDNPVHFENIDATKNVSPLAYKLFQIDGVEAVFIGSDFITITKSEKFDWKILKPEILFFISEHLTNNLPVFSEDREKKEKEQNRDLSDIEKQIVEILDTRVRPSVAMDGGDIVYCGLEDGIVKLRLKGACAGCPSSTVTLKNGIESMLRYFVPEVKEVQEIE